MSSAPGISGLTRWLKCSLRAAVRAPRPNALIHDVRRSGAAGCRSGLCESSTSASVVCARFYEVEGGPVRGSSAIWAQTRVPPIVTRSTPQRSLSICTMFNPKPPPPLLCAGRGAIAPSRPGSWTSRRTMLFEASTRKTSSSSADAPLWSTLLVTSSDASSCDCSSAEAVTRSRSVRVTIARAAAGAWTSGARRASCARVRQRRRSYGSGRGGARASRGCRRAGRRSRL